MEGWVHLWRKSIKKGWLKNHKLWVFWTYCLMKASGLDTGEIQGYQEVKLKRGQFIFGLKQASKDLKMGTKSIRTCIIKLQKWGNIGKQSGNRFSIITVLNYNNYNPLANEKGKQKGKRVASKWQTSGKQVASQASKKGNIKEGIKEREEGKESKERYKDFVLLSQNEYKKLISQFGEKTTNHYIERLNNYIGSKGKSYKSHYYTLLNWIDKNQKGDKDGQASKRYAQPDTGKYAGISTKAE